MRKSLILGGTNFIGRNLVERLLELEDYELSLFNRQLTHADLFPNVNKLKGDRETDDINQISNHDWDYVIDLSCYYPNALRSAINALKNIDRYIFISTCSVYNNENNKTILRNEQSGLLQCTSDQLINRDGDTYGNRKAACERILKDSDIPYTIFRPALVFGQYDPTDRLYYWLYHVKKTNTLILPERGEQLFSTTYVKDLVDCIV